MFRTPAGVSRDGASRSVEHGACTAYNFERSLTKHPPVQEGSCSACHLPHGSDVLFLLADGGQPAVCGKCHEWSKHSMHPRGPDVADPRNKTLAVDCDACHRTHGTEFKHLAHFDTKKELCLQCHTKMGD